MATYRYKFEPYNGGRGKHTCPQCGQAKKFARYINPDTGQPYADHVGICDRKDNCRYNYTPAQYFADNPQQPERWKESNLWQTTYTPTTAAATQAKPIDFLPWGLLEASQKQYEANNFIRYLVQLFGQEKAYTLAREYNLGTSKKWRNGGGLSVVFWQVDRAGNIRQAKVMAYNPTTGRRLKEEGKSFVSFEGKTILKDKDANLQQCFFGEHLLAKYPAKPVCLVESEKTAIIMAGYMPSAVWLGTGGQHGAKWTAPEVFQALEGRKVTLYPDLGAFDDWKERAKILATVCDVTTSDLLERKAQFRPRKKGWDMADEFTETLQQPQEEAQSPQAEAQAVHVTEKAQEAPREAPAQEESLEAREAGQSLPEGFTVAGNGVLEFNGIPFSWYTDEEQEQALARLEGPEVLPLLQALNPLVSDLIERFELEVSK